MIRIPDFQTDLLFSETEPAPAGDKTETGAPVKADEVAAVGEEVTETTTTQAVPLKPQVTGALEPISGLQTFILVMFGVLAFVMLVAMTRYGSERNYGD